jgi:membrane dipeptidase
MFSFYNYFVTCSDTASLKDVKDHINYVRNLIGSDYIGIGSDYDGVAEYFIIRKN